jgi:hypothetical protein
VVGGSNRRLTRRAKGQSRVGLTASSGEDRRKAHGGARASPAAATSSKAVQLSRDRGCNGHRILRRVPADGRHSGSSRGVVVHARRSRVVLALFRTLRPVSSRQKQEATVTMQLSRRRVRREGERESATGVSEARSHPHRGKKTPTLRVQGREAEARGSRVDDDPPKRSWTS